MTPLVLTGDGVSIEDVAAVARDAGRIEVTPAVIERLAKARKVLDPSEPANALIDRARR